MATMNPNSIFAGTDPNQKLPNVFLPAPAESTPPSGAIARTLNVGTDQPPVLQKVDFGGGQDSLSSVVPDRARNQLARVIYLPPPDQQHLDTLRAQRQQLYDTDARGWGFKGAPPSLEHPNGLAPNHPGTWGHIAHVLSTAGQIAGNIVAPDVMAGIPGTRLNRMVQEQQDTGEINRLQQLISENNNRDAQTAGQQFENTYAPADHALKQKLTQSEIDNQQSEIYGRQHPQLTNAFELWHQQNPSGTLQDYEAATNQGKTLTADDANALNGIWNSIAGQYHLPMNQFRAGMSHDQASELTTSMNSVVGRNQGQQHIIIEGNRAANAGDKTRDANTEKAYNAAFKDLNSQFSAAQTQAETLATAQEELNSGAVGQAAGTIKTLVGLAGGKGSGVRITQAELNAIAHARGVAGDFEGWINRVSGQGHLSGEQLSQMNSILSDIQGKLRQKMGLQDQYMDKLASANSEQEIRQIQSQYRKEFLNPSANAASTHDDDIVYDARGVAHRYKGTGDRRDPKNWEEVR